MKFVKNIFDAPYKILMGLLYIYFVLDSLNFVTISLRSLYYLLIFSGFFVLFTVFVYYGINSILKNKYKSNMIAFLLTFVCLYFKNIENYFSKETNYSDSLSNLSNINVENASYLIILTIVISSFLTLYFINRKFIRVDIFLKIFFCVLIIFKLLQVTSDISKEVKINTNERIDSLSGIHSKPNIYLFLLDSYTSNSALKKYFSFNNDRFCKSLIKHNFIVSDSNRTNYNWTLNSISSMFNMNYLSVNENSNSIYASKKIN